MSKYTEAELADMARTVLFDNSGRREMLVVILANQFGVEPQIVMAKIQEMAR